MIVMDSVWIDSIIFMSLLLKRDRNLRQIVSSYSQLNLAPTLSPFIPLPFLLFLHYSNQVFYFDSKGEYPHHCSLLFSVQVTPFFQPVKQTTCRTRVTARSPLAPASAQSTLCRLPGLRTGVTAAPGPALILLLALLQLPPQHLLRLLRAQRQHMHTRTPITTSPAQGK